MKTKTASTILDYIRKNGKARPDELVRFLGISHVALHRQLRGLMEKGLLVKQGSAPRVYYDFPLETRTAEKSISVHTVISQTKRRLIDLDYLSVSPKGELREGYDGFTSWVRDIGEEERLEALIDEYICMRKEADQYIKKGRIDATEKIEKTFDHCYLDRLFYQDFYSLPKFGKTKLGALMLYANQSQQRALVKRIIVETKKTVGTIIREFNIQAVAYIPPTVPRAIQFQKEFAHGLLLTIPEISLRKLRQGEVIVPQKTLSRLEERIINAQSTIVVERNTLRFRNILLIDDAAGSGATMNETAKKLKEEKLVKNVIGFAIVGSYKGFDIIREV